MMNYTCKTQKRCETIVEGHGAVKPLVKVRRVLPSIFRPCRFNTIGRLRAESTA
ncbi:hypothetical protein FA13DRAFT_1740803 [Coprinellus micaceus]|uniref:Uncharacterized protein n=2 Tax=Coprinellus micaceus TaxID=71717 RepID=A0A4Y7SL39_COPMI|nr:hypothetical protein FA13DRAFT_1740803 [Coprinellus micaceus]